MSLRNHLSFAGNSGYVSVTKSPSIAAAYAFGRTGSKLKKGYVYLISPTEMTDDDLGGRVEDDEVYPSPYVRVKGDGIGAKQYGRVEDAESGPAYGRVKHAGDKPTSRESGESGLKALVKELADDTPYGRVRLAPSRTFGRDRPDKLRQILDITAWEREFFHRAPFHRRPFRPDTALGHHFGDIRQGSRSRGPTSRESRLAKIKTLAHMVNSNKAERQPPSADDWLLAQILTDDMVPAPADSQDLMVWMHETNPKSFAALAVAMKRGLMSTEECIMTFREAAKRVLTARHAEVSRLGASAGLWAEVVRETQGLVARRIRMADPWRVM